MPPRPAVHQSACDPSDARRTAMRGLLRCVITLAMLPALASTAFAQGTLTGTVRDASGAVLPGVTVEASSPAIQGGVRSVVTDGSGIYRIIELSPGVYSMTFSLA